MSANSKLTLRLPLISLALILIFSSQLSLVHADTSHRPDAHAPISVMADHSHAKGEIMFSYRFMQMKMEGNRDGSNELSNSEVLAGPGNTGNHVVAPLDMTMDMHMLGAMYAPSDEITLMLGVPFIEKSMDHLIAPDHMANPGQEFTTESSSLGDVKIGAIFNLSENETSKVIAGVSLSLPTGSIDEEGEIASAPPLGETQLPFPMQIGSGTYDLLPSVTYTRKSATTSLGAQLNGVFRTGTNDNDYTLGNRIQAQIWHAWVLNKNVSLSTRLSSQAWGNIDGDDNKRALPRTIMNGRDTVPTVNPNNQGGKRVDYGFGINTIFGEQHHRIAAEFIVPVYQNLDGPQMQSDIAFTLGYQKTF